MKTHKTVGYNNNCSTGGPLALDEFHQGLFQYLIYKSFMLLVISKPR